MKSKLIFISILLSQTILAQTFTEAAFMTPFDAGDTGAIAFSDVDGDNDEDVLFVGQNSSFENIAKLYINDGLGNFSEALGTPFTGVQLASVAFADIDSDNDQDVLIIGRDNMGALLTKLFANNGLGVFTEVANTPFEGANSGYVAFADVDGDNDQDVLITGQNDYTPISTNISKLYLNDGLGNFSEALNAPFEAVNAGSIAFSDIDSDGDQDVLITGEKEASERISKLYTNDGAGNFTEVLNTPFEGVFTSSIAFSDVDGDNDQDVLITGRNNAAEPISKLYLNDGAGNFTEVMDSPFENITSGSVAFSDVDGDDDQDVLITGWNGFDRISKLYTNDGFGNFSEVLETPFVGVNWCSTAFSDVDGDNDQDILISGRALFGARLANLYINESMISSTRASDSALDLEFRVYPNPTNTKEINIRIDAEEEGRLVQIMIFDLYGRLIKQQQEQIQGSQLTFLVDISTLSKGSYVMTVCSGLRGGIQKVLVW